MWTSGWSAAFVIWRSQPSTLHSSLLGCALYIAKCSASFQLGISFILSFINSIMSADPEKPYRGSGQLGID